MTIIYRCAALIFDFDGVVLDSEIISCAHLSEFLTEADISISLDEVVTLFLGISGEALSAAVKKQIGCELPAEFFGQLQRLKAEAMQHGIDPVDGVLSFLTKVPSALPRAIATSSSSTWVARHLDYLGIRDFFGSHIFSGAEHVTNSKPAPDIYLHTASMIGIPIGNCVVLEDSAVGAQAALAAGAQVIGVCAGQHCMNGHRNLLAQVGVQQIVERFDELSDMLVYDH